MAVLIAGFGSASSGQESPVFVELFGGAGFLAQSGGTYDEFNGNYSYPAGAEGQFRTYYSSEYLGHFFLRINLGWRLSEHFSVNLSNQFSSPRYAFNNDYYIVNTERKIPSGPPSGYPALKLASSCYYYTPALGIRANLFNHTESPYVELLYGRTFRHLDLEQDSNYYDPSRFSPFSHLRDRSSRAYMQIGIGAKHRLGERSLLHLRIGLDTIHEAGGGTFFLETSGQYLTFDGSIGIGYSF